MCYQLTVPVPSARKSGSNSSGCAAALSLAHRRFGLRAGAAQIQQRRQHVLIDGESASACGVPGSSPSPAGSLSRNSSTMRSAVFLPYARNLHQLFPLRHGGWRESNLAPQARKNLIANVGRSRSPDQLLKQRFSRPGSEIRRAPAHLRGRGVWNLQPHSRAGVGPGLVKVDTGIVTSIPDHPPPPRWPEFRMLLQQYAAQQMQS
jgi:hypothetical protein